MNKRFRLQPVLKHREILEELARRKLAASMAGESALCERISHRREALAVLGRKLEDWRGTEMPIHDLLLYEAHIRRLENGLGDLTAELDLLRREKVENLQILSQACQGKKLLEKLKDRHEAEQKRLDDRREAVLLDEIALRSGKVKI